MVVQSSQTNPYIIGRSIYEKNLFFGRKSLFKFIEDNLRSKSQIILLHGQRRIGKTTVLHHIPNFVCLEDFIFVPFDLQDQTDQPLGNILSDLTEAIAERLNLSESQISLLSADELEKKPELFASNFLPQVYQALGDKNLVLLLDEFDVLSDDREDTASELFFRYLQSILSQQKQLFIIPVIGRQLDELKKLLTLFKEAPREEIGLLDEEDAKDLIVKPAAGLLKYDDTGAIQQILELTSGHPYFTQAVCFALFGRKREQQKKNVTREDVEKIADTAIKYTEAGLTWFREALPIPEQVFFSAVAETQRRAELKAEGLIEEPWKLLKEYGVEQIKPLEQAADNLVKWGFLELAQGSELPLKMPAYKVKVELVRRWLVKQHPLSREIRELENLDLKAQRLYVEATEQLQSGDQQNAFRLYEQVLKANPNYFSALSALAEISLKRQEFNKAVEFYRRAFPAYPVRNQDGFVQSLLSYGQELMLQEQLNLAKQQFAKVLEMEPENVLALEQLEKAKALIPRLLESQNPFFVGGPVPLQGFVGRESEIRIAFDVIAKRSHLAIYGSPGIGKSSLLNCLTFPEVWQLRREDYTKALIVYLNCSDINPFTPSAFWREVLSLLRDEAEDNDDFKAVIDEVLKGDTIEKRDIRRILREIGQQDKDKFLLLLIDDYDSALHPNDEYTEVEMLTFLSESRNLAVDRKVSRHLCTIVTTFRRLNELGPTLPPSGSPWYNHYLFQPLKPFSKAEVNSLFFRSDEKLFIPISPTLQEGILAITDGYPALLQNAGYLLYDMMPQDGKKLDVEAFIRGFQSRTEPLFAEIWASSTNIEQLLLIMIALSGLEGRLNNRQYALVDIDLIFSRSRDLIDLEERGVIKCTVEARQTVYTFASSMMEWWVLQEIKNSNEAQLEQWEKVFLDLMSRAQAEQVKKVIQQVWQHPEISQSLMTLIIRKLGVEVT